MAARADARHAAAPGLAEDQLDGHGEAAVGAARQALDEAAPTAPAGQGPAAAAGHVDGADGPQIAHQRRDVGIGDLDAVDVEHGLGEARRQREIAEVVHVECRVDVDLVVDGREGRAHLLQRVGPERREQQRAAVGEHARGLREQPVRAAPRQHEVREHELGAAARSGNASASPPSTATAGAACAAAERSMPPLESTARTRAPG